ncbi:MAG: Gfo/Idh/MocA family oxidoreductase [Acidimicrobiia bacterium]
MTSQRVRAAVVGSGYWGPNIIRNFWEMPDVDLVGIADLNRNLLERVAERYRTVDVFTTDYRELLELDLDAVAICTPPETHHAIASDFLMSEHHVLVEKPLTVSATTAADLAIKAEHADRILMVGHTFEYNQAVRDLKGIIDSGELGRILYIDGVRVGLGLFHPTLNVIWDLAPHDISILNYLTGTMPSDVSARGAACVHEDVADVAYLTLNYPNGMTANTRMSWLDPLKTRRITVVGSEKMVVYDDVEPMEKLRIFDKRVTTIRRTDTYGDFQFAYHYGSVVSPHIHFEEPLRVECRQFIESIRTGKAPTSDGASGLRVVQVIEAAQKSLADSGAPTDVNTMSARDLIESTSGQAAR